MKIGEFAKMCGTKISVLRHYDREQLLEPQYTDKFSGYRYYSSEQILTFYRINALKKAGFSLQEIKEIISGKKSNKEIEIIFSQKEKKFLDALKNLKEAKLMMTKLDIVFCDNTAIIRRSADDNAVQLCTVAEAEIKAADYQRISQYDIKEDEIICRVIKLGDEAMQPEKEIPFVNDEKAIGKWEIKGVFAVKEDYNQNIFCDNTGFYGGDVKYLYFLPRGEEYWGYSWTKGYFISNSYLFGNTYSEYEIEEKTDGTYMLITLRETEVCRGGNPVYMLLKKADSNKYSAESIARKDDTDKPFINDERIIGKWVAHSFLCAEWDEADFPGEQESADDLYFKELHFFPDGNAKCVYADAVFEGKDTVVWTKNYLLRKWNWSACEYEIRTVNGKDYMIIEWKSGDWRYGGYDTNYYVFTRA
ncbi:MAG: MerR family transcriptional regulator [Clostridia bacterium]|nr:MerR family transcriptional regulator [Clostridia bacterium]